MLATHRITPCTIAHSQHQHQEHEQRRLLLWHHCCCCDTCLSTKSNHLQNPNHHDNTIYNRTSIFYCASRLIAVVAVTHSFHEHGAVRHGVRRRARRVVCRETCPCRVAFVSAFIATMVKLSTFTKVSQCYGSSSPKDNQATDKTNNSDVKNNNGVGDTFRTNPSVGFDHVATIPLAFVPFLDLLDCVGILVYRPIYSQSTRKGLGCPSEAK